MHLERPAILVLCPGNSCRSKMAEGFLRTYVGNRFDIYSAGLEPEDEIHPYAKLVMLETGIDLSGQSPKSARAYLGRLSVRHLIVVCAHAEQKCPRMFPGALRSWYRPFDNPANATRTDEERLAKFREARDQIRQKIREWLPIVESHQ